MIILFKKHFYLLISVLIMAWGCAKIGAPSGGPRDVTPPVAVASTPENGALNFSQKRLVITFSEYIVLDRINEKFMVSPPMEKVPDIYIRGKNLNVEYEDDLRDSTTYTFNFQDAIRDLNEGNILNNYQFVLSTGDVIDSLSVTGYVFSAANLNIPENTIVMLHSNLMDSAVQKSIPDYISRVNPDGSFNINNIRAGNYRLYALTDIDNSKNYNQIEEAFAFLDSILSVTPERNYLPVKKDSAAIKPGMQSATGPLQKPGVKPGLEISDSSLIKTGITLLLFTGPNTEHYLTSSARKMQYQLVYTLSLPPDTLDFDFSIPGIGPESYFIEKSRNKDTIQVWLTDSSLFSQQQITTVIKYPFTDTTNVLTSKEDTILMRFLTPRQIRGTVKKAPLQVTINIAGGTIKPGQDIHISSVTPLGVPDTSRIKLYEQSDSSEVSYSLVRDTVNSGRYNILADLDEGKRYLFISDSAAFGNIYGDYSDSTGINFSIPEARSYGELSVNISQVEHPLIIQVLDQTEKVIREQHLTRSGKVDFPLMDRGTYRLRAIFDLNGDGRWTTGDFEKGRQPEPVSYYHNTIEIRTDWKVENDWTPRVENFKEQKFRAIDKSIR